MSDQILSNELIYTAKLDCKHRGELAELAFMRKAANLGFAVAKPWGDSDRYDVILRFGQVFSRVQIKSVLAKDRGRKHYRANSRNSNKKAYTSEEIDFLAATSSRKTLGTFSLSALSRSEKVCVTPGEKENPMEVYREAWDLMRVGAESNTPAADWAACDYAQAAHVRDSADEEGALAKAAAPGT